MNKEGLMDMTYPYHGSWIDGSAAAIITRTPIEIQNNIDDANVKLEFVDNTLIIKVNLKGGE